MTERGTKSAAHTDKNVPQPQQDDVSQEASSQLNMFQQGSVSHSKLKPDTIVQMSRTLGNQAVMRMLSSRSKTETHQPAAIPPTTKPMLQAKGVAIHQSASPGVVQREFEATQMHTVVQQLPALNFAQELQAFENEGGLSAQIATACRQMAKDKGTGVHTVTMFTYLHRHAAALAGAIGTDFGNMEEVNTRNRYLQKLSTEMSTKIGGRNLWVGDDDRGMMAVGVLDARTYFEKGRVTLLQQATASNGRIRALLENLSDNLEAKSYGRRVESLEIINAANLPDLDAVIVIPEVNKALPYDTDGYVYYDIDFIEVIPAEELKTEAQLQQEKAEDTQYGLIIHQKKQCEVTVSNNDINGRQLTFSKVRVPN